MPPTAMPKQHSARKKPNRGHSQSAQGRPWTNRRPAHRHVHEVHGHQPDRKRRAGILTAERTALNFIQLLSGVATATHALVEIVKGTRARILDTRKTLPGLRLAQKYAVRIGGGENHRRGLYDGILIKENHIAAGGGIAPTVRAVQELGAGVPVQVEVETLDELAQALSADAGAILLDNFSLEQMREAVRINNGRASLERAEYLPARATQDW